MADTYNVGAINSALQNFAREVYGTGRGSSSPAREQLYRDRSATEAYKREQERIEYERRQAEDAMVKPMAEAFAGAFMPAVPVKPTGQSVPMPVARPGADIPPLAEATAAPVEVPGIDFYGTDTTRQYPVFQHVVPRETVEMMSEGQIRGGLAKGDLSKVNGAIADMIATMITASNGVTEADAFRGNALRGNSTPQNQSYTMEGADAVARRNHDFSVEKKALENDVRRDIAQGRNDTTMRGQDMASADRQRGQDMTSTDRQRGQDMTSTDRQRGQDIDSADRQRGQDTASADRRYGMDSQAAPKLPQGIPKSPDEIAKFDQLTKMKILERLGADPKGEVAPEVVRRVSEEYAKILNGRQAGSPNTALEMAIDRALTSAKTSKGGFFGTGKVDKVEAGNPAASPSAPPPQAPQTGSQPAMSRRQLDDYYAQTLREIEARNEPAEMKAARRAKLDELYKKMSVGAR